MSKRNKNRNRFIRKERKRLQSLEHPPEVSIIDPDLIMTKRKTAKEVELRYNPESGNYEVLQNNEEDEQESTISRFEENYALDRRSFHPLSGDDEWNRWPVG